MNAEKTNSYAVTRTQHSETSQRETEGVRESAREMDASSRRQQQPVQCC